MGRCVFKEQQHDIGDTQRQRWMVATVIRHVCRAGDEYSFPPLLRLEDQVFGPYKDEEPHPTVRRVPSAPMSPPGDIVNRCMVPLIACIVVIVVVLWSLTKAVQYTELFATNPRYAYGLWSLNVSVVILSTAVLCYNGRP